jgi:hypothetical protein
LEGSITDICHGKPIAYIGHKVSCPLCKGTYPIVEGVQTTSFYGKGVALAGMKTACGASLIATQFTDTVEWSGGASAAAAATASASRSATLPVASTTAAAQQNSVFSQESADDLPFDEQYVLLDEEESPLAHTPYTIKLASGDLKHGTTDANGKTARYVTNSEEHLEVYIGHI